MLSCTFVLNWEYFEVAWQIMRSTAQINQVWMWRHVGANSKLVISLFVKFEGAQIIAMIRAVDNALNVIQSVVRLERERHYRSRKCCSVRITCTVAANIFFKCKFENFLMVVSTMCPHIKVAELNTLSDGKGITGIHIAICQWDGK